MNQQKFGDQAVIHKTIDGMNNYEASKHIYPDAFSVGYVRGDNVPKMLKPSYFVAPYAPDIVSARRSGQDFDNTTNDVFDVFYMGEINTITIPTFGTGINSIAGASELYNNTTEQPITIRQNQWSYLYGKFNALQACKPSYVTLTILFTGYANNTQYLQTFVTAFNLNIEEFRALKGGSRAWTFDFIDKTWNLQDLAEGFLIYDEPPQTAGASDNAGLFLCCFTFSGFSRNVRPDGSTGDYTYIMPGIGFLYDVPELAQPNLVVPEWGVYGAWGSSPGGGAYHIQNWGRGWRIRPAGRSANPYFYFESPERVYSVDSGDGVSALTALGYPFNQSGFLMCWPPQSTSSLMYPGWESAEVVRYYLERIEEGQNSFYLPEGRSDFANQISTASFADIWKLACLVPVWAMPGHEYEYAKQNEWFWYAKTAGHEFLGDLIQGNDPDILDNVESWILEGDSTQNTYLPEDDRPGPEDPDGPDDDKANETGSKPTTKGDGLAPQYNPEWGTLPSSFFNMYCLSNAQMTNLGNALWANFGSEQYLQNFWTAVFSTATLSFSEVLKYLPVVRQYPINFLTWSHDNPTTDTGSTFLYFARGTGGIDMGSSVHRFTTLMPWVGNSYITVPTPSDFRDLEPVSTAQLYIPYCGMYPVPLTDVAGAQLQMLQFLNLLNGTLVSYVTRIAEGEPDRLLFVASGNIGTDIPLNTDGVADKLAMLAGSIAIPTITAGAIGATTATAAGLSQLRGGPTAFTDPLKGHHKELYSGAAAAGSGVASVAQQLGLTGGTTTMTTPVLPSGLSLYAPQVPALIIRKAYTVKAGNHSSTHGNPLRHKRRLYNCKGWTVCHNPQINIVRATSSEREEIKQLLESGIYA